MLCAPAPSPDSVTVAVPLAPFGTSDGLNTVESTVTATVPPGALVPVAADTVTVNVTSVPATNVGFVGVGTLMFVVVATAVPVSVPVNVRLPAVDAAGRYVSTSLTVPVPAPTKFAVSVHALPAACAARMLELNVQPLAAPPVTLKFVVFVTVFEPVTA